MNLHEDYRSCYDIAGLRAFGQSRPASCSCSLHCFARCCSIANLLWSKLGLLLGKVATPVITAPLFYLVVIPTGLLVRMMGKDALRLRRTPPCQSYWIDRRPPGSDPKTMSSQF